MPRAVFEDKRYRYDTHGKARTPTQGNIVWVAKHDPWGSRRLSTLTRRQVCDLFELLGCQLHEG